MWLVAGMCATRLLGGERVWGQSLPVEVVEIARGGRLLAPNFFALTVDPQGNVYVGGANSNNVLRMAPRGDTAGGGAGDGPCVAELLSPEKASQRGFVFAAPKGIALASDGSVYVVGTGGASNQNDDLVRIGPDGTITEVVSRADLGRPDWNPAGIVVDESGGTGPYVYATGPAPAIGIVVRVAPDLTAEEIVQVGGQGLAVDEAGTLYLAQIGEDRVVRIPDARSGVCGEDGKVCDALIEDGEIGCDGEPVRLDGPYAMGLAGGILYVSAQNSRNVVRRPLRSDNALGLPLCAQSIFASGDAGLLLDTPRALAADAAGNVYAAGFRSDNLVWLRPDPAVPGGVIPQEVVNRSWGLAAPQAAAVDRHGNVYVSGAATHNVFRIRTVTAGSRCGNGAMDRGEACDYRRDCCCTTACEPQLAGMLCRDSAGDCDAADVCDGAVAVCGDGRQPVGTSCRSRAGACDIEESCDGGIACPGDQVLPAGTGCRVAENECDEPEQCDGRSATCPQDLGKEIGEACRLGAGDIGGAEPACIGETGQCSATRACRPQSRTGEICVPAGLRQSDLACVRAARCTAAGVCDVQTRDDGEQCGGFCAHTECREGRCVPDTVPHPCGSGDAERCSDTAPPGRECVLCGNRQVDPFEQCDDGNEDPARSDGCTARCRFACDPDATGSCGQPFLAEGVADPCRRSACSPVDLDPGLASEGFACEIERAPGCTSCIDVVQDCPAPGACAVADCVENRCVQASKVGIDLATCAFAVPFPAEGSDCAPGKVKNRPGVMAGIAKLEAEARAALEEGLCSGGAGTPKKAATRHARDRLRRAILRANVLRTPFRQKISPKCENLLTARFDGMIQNLKSAAAGPAWECPR